MTIDGTRFLLANIYAPSGGGAATVSARKKIFTNISARISSYTNAEFVILGGDFNCTLNTQMDRSRFTIYPDRSLPSLNQVIHELNLEDIWRTFHPHEREYTLCSTVGTYTRIDRFYTTRPARGIFESCEIIPFAHSDHDMVTLKLNFSNVELGPGLWKMNTSILTEIEYQDKIKCALEDWKTKKDNFPSLAEWWDEGKYEIGRLTKSFCFARKRKIKQKKNNLYKQLRNANKKAQLTGDTKFKELAKRISADIKSIETYEANGTKIRAKAQWTEEGEKVTKYFCNLEKKNDGETALCVLSKTHMVSPKQKVQILQKQCDHFIKTSMPKKK